MAIQIPCATTPLAKIVLSLVGDEGDGNRVHGSPFAAVWAHRASELGRHCIRKFLPPDPSRCAPPCLFRDVIQELHRSFGPRVLYGHYLVELVACTPASGWEKGQVENQVGVVRQRFFAPRFRAKSYEELNAWLLARCVAFAKANRHPEMHDRSIWEMLEAERASLVPYRGPFNGFHALPASVSKTCLVRFDNNDLAPFEWTPLIGFRAKRRSV